jgi:hypothetical protein
MDLTHDIDDGANLRVVGIELNGTVEMSNG